MSQNNLLGRKVKLVPWDTTDYLKTEEDIASYLLAVREENDPKFSELADRNVAKARARWRIKSTVPATNDKP